MKKIIAFLLVIVSVFTLAACGQQPAQEAVKAAEAPAEQAVEAPAEQAAEAPAAQPEPTPEPDPCSPENLLALAQQTAENSRDYSTVSTTGVELELPSPEDYLDEPSDSQIKFTPGSNGAILIMPKPKAGNGSLGMIKAGTDITIVAQYRGFYFFVADDGRMGWNGKNLF